MKIRQNALMEQLKESDKAKKSLKEDVSTQSPGQRFNPPFRYRYR